MRHSIAGLGLLGVVALAAPVGAAECKVPNLLLVVDRSGSMDEEIRGGGTKWTAAVDALSNLVMTYESKANFGIGLFPGGGEGDRCVTGAIDHTVMAGQAATIATLLQVTPFREGTPIGASITAIANADIPGLSDPAHPGYVLLVTDGKENCDGDPEAAIRALRMRTPEVKTFVVGFGDGVDGRELERLAIAGGTERPSAPRYYQADDPATLQAALDAIATVATGGDVEFQTCSPPGGSGGDGTGGADGDGTGGTAGGGDDGVGEPPTPVPGCACDVGRRRGTQAFGGGVLLAAFALLAVTRARRGAARP